jgi:predicted transcriptional regulator
MMRVKSEYRDRGETEVAVLDALAERHEDGMTVFELRAKVEMNIDSIEDALADLKEEQLIQVSKEGDKTVIVPEDHILTMRNGTDETDLFEKLRERLPF